MSDADTFALPVCFEDATRQVLERFARAGFVVVRSFDLRSAQSMAVGCVCPHHGTAACDCELAVFLVYAAHGSPVTVLAHGHNRRTWLSLVESAQPAVRQVLAELVGSTAAPEFEDET